MENKSNTEKRKYVRLDVDATVNICVKESAQKDALVAMLSAIMKNVSTEGVCFTSEEKLSVGDIIELETCLSSESEPLRLKGEVKWSTAVEKEGKAFFDTGVKLLSIDKSDEHRFINFVCEKMTERLSRYLHL